MKALKFGSRENMDLCSGSMWDKMIIYTLPIILSNFIQMLYHAVDIAVVGQYTGEGAVASVGSTSSSIGLMVNVFIGISVGSSVRVAYYIGTKNKKDIEETVHTAIASAILFGLLGTGLGLLLSRPLLVLLGTPENLMGDALLYMYVYLSGVVFTSIYNFGAGILRSGGDTKRPMYYLMISGLANVGLNYLLTGLLGMGVIGVAAGTVLSKMLSCLMVMVRLVRTKECYRLDLRRIRIHKDKFKEIVQTGLPAGLQSALYAVSNMFIQSALNTCDLIYEANGMLLAGNTASVTIESIFTTCVLSFGTAVTTFAGQNYGAGKLDRVDRVPRLAMRIGAVVWAVVMIPVMLWASFFIGFSVNDPMALSFGALRLRVMVAGCIFNLMADAYIAQSRGLGNSFAPMVISLITSCLFRVVYLNTVFRIVSTYSVVILSYPMGQLLAVILQGLFYRRTRRKIGEEYAAKQLQADFAEA